MSRQQKLQKNKLKKVLTKCEKLESYNLDDDVLYESQGDGIKIIKTCKYWIYVVLKDQWDVIKMNTKKGSLYLGVYAKKQIKHNDLILFYVKNCKGKSSGFVAMGQTCSDMEINDKDIRVYEDNNLNRYITELSVISILHSICDIKDLNHIIKSVDTPISSSVKFTLKLLKGDGVFVEIPYKQLGLALVRKLIDINCDTSLGINQDNESKSNPDDDKSRDMDTESSDDILINDNQDNDDQNNDNRDNDDRDNDDQDNDDQDNDDPDNDDDDNKHKCVNELCDESDTDSAKIVTNAPIMLIICDKLRRSLKHVKQKANKVKSILTHYNYCNKCDITNNNPYEVSLTLARINESMIKFIVNDYKKALNAYLASVPYPKSTIKEFIKIHHMIDNLSYSGDILIEYSTYVDPILHIC